MKKFLLVAVAMLAAFCFLGCPNEPPKGETYIVNISNSAIWLTKNEYSDSTGKNVYNYQSIRDLYLKKLPKAGDSVRISFSGYASEDLGTVYVWLVDNSEAVDYWKELVSYDDRLVFKGVKKGDPIGIDHEFKLSGDAVGNVSLVTYYEPVTCDKESIITWKKDGKLVDVNLNDYLQVAKFVKQEDKNNEINYYTSYFYLNGLTASEGDVLYVHGDYVGDDRSKINFWLYSVDDTNNYTEISDFSWWNMPANRNYQLNFYYSVIKDVSSSESIFLWAEYNNKYVDMIDKSITFSSDVYGANIPDRPIVYTLDVMDGLKNGKIIFSDNSEYGTPGYSTRQNTGKAPNWTLFVSKNKPQVGDKIRVTGKFVSDIDIDCLYYNIVDRSPAANWWTVISSLKESEPCVKDIKAGVPFTIDYTFDVADPVIGNLVLNMAYGESVEGFATLTCERVSVSEY